MTNTLATVRTDLDTTTPAPRPAQALRPPTDYRTLQRLCRHLPPPCSPAHWVRSSTTPTRATPTSC